MFSHCTRIVFVLGLAAAQDLFGKDSNFLAQHGLALQSVDVNKTNLKAHVGHDWWVFQIVLTSNRMLCMDLSNEGADNGTPVQIWECNGHESQLWYFDDGTYKIQWGGNANKCLDAGDQQEGTVVAVWDCNDNDQQVWGYDGSAIFLQNSASDASLCLDVQGGTLQSGSQLEVWGCNTFDQQQFSMQAGITIRSFQNYEMCLDLPGSDTTDGTNLWLWECNGGSGQYWVFDADNTRIQLASDLSKCLDAGDTQAGSNLMLWSCNGQNSQAFGYDPSSGALYSSWSTQSDASLCVDLGGGGLWNGASIDLWNCNNCWNQQFQFWGPSDGFAKLTSAQFTRAQDSFSLGPTNASLRASVGDDCPDVPGTPTPSPPGPSSGNVFPSDHCQYDTGVLPQFNSQQDLQNDPFWSSYFEKIYGAVPSSGYPICPGAFQFLWQNAAQGSGGAQFTDCATGGGFFLGAMGKELNDGTFYTGFSFLEARDVYGYIYNSKLFGAEVPPNMFVEVSHTVFPGDKGAIWYYMSVGSGVWINVGNTKAYTDHADMVQDISGSSCHDEPQDTFGLHPTECEQDFPKLYTDAQAQGLNTIQITGHHDCTCGPIGDSSYKYKRWCNTEIIYLDDVSGGGNGCTQGLKGGWEASADCNCQEDYKSSTREAAAVSYANCGSF